MISIYTGIKDKGTANSYPYLILFGLWETLDINHPELSKILLNYNSKEKQLQVMRSNPKGWFS